MRGAAAGPAWAGGRGGLAIIHISQGFAIMFSQIVFSQGFASAKCTYFRKLSQICFRKNAYISQAFTSFSTFSQIWFRSVLQYFSQGFALSQSFARFRKLTFARFFTRFCNGHFADDLAATKLRLLPASSPTGCVSLPARLLGDWTCRQWESEELAIYTSSKVPQ